MIAALKPLSPKQLAFVDAYLRNGRNATKAAIEAGYAPRSAYNQGARMMRNDDIRAEIGRRVAEYSHTAGLTVVDVLLEMKAIAFSDLRQLFDQHGRLLDPSLWPEGAAKAVAAFDVAGKEMVNPVGAPTRVTWNIRMHDKYKALFALLDFLRHANHPDQSARGDLAARSR